MEQLKPFLDGVKAQKFWIFCGATLIACIGVYYVVSGGLAKEEAASTNKIKSTVTAAKNLETAGVDVNPDPEDGQTSNRAHPNEDTIKAMKVVVKDAAQATKEAWDKKYQLQASFQVFDKATIDELDTDFQQFIPAETVPFTDSEEGLLPETVRVNYRDKIRNELPKLAGIIKSVWKPSFAKGEPRPREVIIWSEDNQKYWHDRFTVFASDWNTAAAESNIPKTLQVLYTTEDLWLLRSILDDVIKKTAFKNGDVYANDLSVVKRIDHILLGKAAEPSADESSLSGGSQGGAGNMMSSSKMMPSSRGGAGGAKKKSDSSLDPINGRYVDNEGKDISARDYRAIYAKKGATDKKKTHWKIAKRVKVRIGLQMDSREIQNLLTNCANANFPIEVRSLRVNKHKASKLSGSGGSGAAGSSSYGSSGYGSNKGMGGSAEDRASGLAGSGGSGASAPGSGGAQAGASRGMSQGGGSQAVSDDEEGYTQPVEIYGFIYIYNKVDEEMFSILNDKQTTP